VTYRVLLAFHLISIISWMAGILYLLRLFVYHAEETESIVKSRFEVMEKRLYQYITLPAALASLLFGFTLLALNTPLLQKGWFHAKLALVAALFAVTYWSGIEIQNFRAGYPSYRARTYRYLNEVPTLLMVAIVFLAVLKLF
jgi:putative membrane protein